MSFMKRYVLILFVMCWLPMLSWGQDSLQVVQPQDDVTVQPVDSVEKLNRFQKIKRSIKNKLNAPYDTTRDNRYWWRAMKHGKVDFNDSTIHYPKFVRFCWNAYKWGDKAFNSYDPEYVVSTGKNWKFIFKSDNWIDSYYGHPDNGINMIMNSNLVSNVGLSLSFMAVSVGYSVSVSNLLNGGKLSNKFDFSFTCARFAADFYFWENSNEIKVRYTDKSVDDEQHDFRQTGITRKAMGLTAFYFFNNRKYAQAAAYCFSKYQKRSAGSWLAGLSFQHFDAKANDELPDDVPDYIHLQNVLPILYDDYCVLFGYGYNWVLNRHWLLNLTATPYIGYRNNYYHADDKTSAISLNLRARLGLVYNHPKFFAGFQSFADHHNYRVHGTRLINSLIDFNLLVGLRF